MVVPLREIFAPEKDQQKITLGARGENYISTVDAEFSDPLRERSRGYGVEGRLFGDGGGS